MFISPAYAQGAGGLGGGLEAFLPLILIFAVFYFLLIRPQQRKVKMHREMLGRIRRGDKVVTGGGIVGTVTKVTNDEELAVEIAEGIKVRVMRGTIAQVLSRSEPQAGDASGQGQQQGGLFGGGSLLGKLFGGNKS